MRTALLLIGLASLLAVPAVAAGPAVTVSGEVAGVPFSVGPVPFGPTCGFHYQTPDLGVFYSEGGGWGGPCHFYVRAL